MSFKISNYYHGTSFGAVGEEQLQNKQFEARGPRFHAHLWATDNLDLAIRHAEKSGRITQTPPVLLQVRTDQPLKYVYDYGKHSYPAFNTHEAPIYIDRVIPLTNRVAIAVAKTRSRLPALVLPGLIAAGAATFVYNKEKASLPANSPE